MVLQWGGRFHARLDNGKPPETLHEAAEWLLGCMGVDPAEFRATSDQCRRDKQAEGFTGTVDDKDKKEEPFQAKEGPRPLRRELSPADPFPIDALGQVLGAAADAIIDKVKCPDALAGCSVLAAASLAVQAHVDVGLARHGPRRDPLSLFLMTVAASGDRKS